MGVVSSYSTVVVSSAVVEIMEADDGDIARVGFVVDGVRVVEVDVFVVVIMSLLSSSVGSTVLVESNFFVVDDILALVILG
jgi:hypothetical protein